MTLAWFSIVVAAWCMPISSALPWAAVFCFALLTYLYRPNKTAVVGYPRYIVFYGFFLAGAAILLRFADAIYDTVIYPLPPIGTGPTSKDYVTVYVGSRDFQEYRNVIESIEASSASSLADASTATEALAKLQSTLQAVEQSYKSYSGLPRLDLRVIDAGSAVPLSPVGHATVERINDYGEDTGIPMFSIWEHIARTATSERVFYLDADNLIPSNFNWPLYMEGSWMFVKEYRDYTTNFAVPLSVLQRFMSRLRSSSHLYRWWIVWGGMEDKLSIFFMNLNPAPDRLTYFKLQETREMQAKSEFGFDRTRVFDRYLLEFNHEMYAPDGFLAVMNGLLNTAAIRTFLGGYGIFALGDLCLFVEMILPFRLVAKALIPMPSFIPSSFRIAFVDASGILCSFVVMLVASSALLLLFDRHMQQRKNAAYASTPKENYGSMTC